eukprot:TRINITY_DN22835_c0_g1_i1.p1 TRINITY_DN22835_c0_g1~~TRINITY_DN22835_c0_g1_i1.p1  ORF type:complete len:653 (+),score=106.51 TRINITY_DN22835_c0_g1_i1:79-2037(+)
MGASIDLFSTAEQPEAEEQPDAEAASPSACEEAAQHKATSSSASSEAVKAVRVREAVKLPSTSAGKNGKLQKPPEWSSRQLPHRLFCVVRHSERADAMGALFAGRPWTLTEEFRIYPTDPPLSDAGRQQAENIGRQVREFADRWSERPANADSAPCPPHPGIHVVVCSPYLRCVETAIQVCRQLGPQCKLIVDNSLAEVYGTCILGENEPVRRLQPFWKVAALARSAGIRCAAKPCGVFPSWPESLKGARLRYAATFFNYLQRAEYAKRNFVLVSHADCLATVLALMPSKAGQLIDSVSYGATVFASRPGTDARSKPGTDARPQNGSGQLMTDLRSRLPSTMSSQTTATSSSDGINRTPYNSEDSCTSEGSKEGVAKTGSRMHSDPNIVSALRSSRFRTQMSTSWEVETTGLTMGPQWRDGTAASRAVKAALKTDMRLRSSGQLDEKTMDALLGGLSQEPLGEVTPYKPEKCFGTGDGVERGHGALDITDDDGESSCSSSTYMFGASESSMESGLTPRSAHAMLNKVDENPPVCGRSLSENGQEYKSVKHRAREANEQAKANKLSRLRDDGLRVKTAAMPSHPELEDHDSSNLFRPLADTGELHHGTCAANIGVSPASPAVRRQSAENVQLQGCASSAIMARRKGNMAKLTL